MRLERLHHVMGIESWILIFESHNETQGDDVIFAAVNPCPTIFLTCERPSCRVDHFSRCDPPRGQLPEFLYANAVGLRIAFLVESEASNQLLRQRSTSAL